jgi:hypothetical protein
MKQINLSNQATKPLKLKLLLVIINLSMALFANAQTGVINLSTPEYTGEGHAFVNTKAFIQNAKIGEIYSEDAIYEAYSYMQANFAGDNYSPYFNISLSIESADGGTVWVGIPNPTGLYSLNLNCTSNPGYPYRAKVNKSAIIRISITRKLNAPDNDFRCK